MRNTDDLRASSSSIALPLVSAELLIPNLIRQTK
jgi:hypothetical protein